MQSPKKWNRTHGIVYYSLVCIYIYIHKDDREPCWHLFRILHYLWLRQVGLLSGLHGAWVSVVRLSGYPTPSHIVEGCPADTLPQANMRVVLQMRAPFWYP